MSFSVSALFVCLCFSPGGFDDVYRIFLVDTPIGPYFEEYLREADRDKDDMARSGIETSQVGGILTKQDLEIMKTSSADSKKSTCLGVTSISILSRDPSFYKNRQKPWGNGWFLNRTMSENNVESTPRACGHLLCFGFGSREKGTLCTYFDRAKPDGWSAQNRAASKNTTCLTLRDSHS